MKTGVTNVPNRLIDDIWPHVVPLLLKGEELWSPYYNLEDFREEFKLGKQQLWVAVKNDSIHMILTTMLVVYPRATYLRYWYMGGSGLRALLKYRTKIERWAQSQGAVGYEIAGRFPWLAVERKTTRTKNFRQDLFVTGLFENKESSDA